VTERTGGYRGWPWDRPHGQTRVHPGAEVPRRGRLPADRDQLVVHAREHGADDEVLQTLEAIGDRRYEDPTEVSEAVAGSR